MKIRKLIVIMFIAVTVLFNSPVFTNMTFAGTTDKKVGTIVGAPTQKTWTFEANKSGTYKIVFTYARPWEKENSNAKTAVYKIKVKNKNGKKSGAVELAKGKINIVNRNQKFFITLSENASTGYSWSYKASAKVIKLTDEEIANDDGTPTVKKSSFK